MVPSGFTEEDLFFVCPNDSPHTPPYLLAATRKRHDVLITTPGSPRLGVNAPLVVAGTLAARKKTAWKQTSRSGREPEGGQHTMPFCDAYISEGALSPASASCWAGSPTCSALQHGKGVYPTNETGRRIAWVFVHRHEMYVAGEPALILAIASSATFRRASTTTSAVPR